MIADAVPSASPTTRSSRPGARGSQPGWRGRPRGRRSSSRRAAAADRRSSRQRQRGPLHRAGSQPRASLPVRSRSGRRRGVGRQPARPSGRQHPRPRAQHRAGRSRGSMSEAATTSSSVGSSSMPSASCAVRALRPSIVATTRAPPAARTRPTAAPIAPGLTMPTVITRRAYSASDRNGRAGRLRYDDAPVAQWTERRTSNPRVGGSNPPGRTTNCLPRADSDPARDGSNAAYASVGPRSRFGTRSGSAARKPRRTSNCAI